MSTKQKNKQRQKYGFVRLHQDDDLLLTQLAAMNGKTKIQFVKGWLESEFNAMPPAAQKIVLSGIENRKKAIKS